MADLFSTVHRAIRRATILLSNEATYKQVEAIFSFVWPDGFVTSLDATGMPDNFVECPFF